MTDSELINRKCDINRKIQQFYYNNPIKTSTQTTKKKTNKSFKANNLDYNYNLKCCKNANLFLFVLPI